MDRNDVERNYKRNYIIETSYKLFTKKGLEKTSVRDIASLTGMNVNTIYYYFRTKAEIVICCVEYGLEHIFQNIFERIKLCDLNEAFLLAVLEFSLSNKEELCWCYQVITSPNYNWMMKDILLRTRNGYKKYISDIAQENNIPEDKLQNIASIIVLIIKDYMISEDENCKEQMKFVSNQLYELMQINKKNGGI